MKKEIFKAYDIRGIYPEEIDEDAVNRIGQAYIKVLKEDWKDIQNKNIVVGCDVRISSPSLKQALIEGITSQGVGVIDIGTISTDMLYFALGHLNADGGIVITASHNPAEYNGLKMLRKGVIGISGDSGLKKIANLALAEKYFPQNSNPGTVTIKDLTQEYVQHIKSFIDFENLQKTNFKGAKLRILLNANYGVAGKYCSSIIDGLPIEATTINFKADGNFPDGPPNPMLENNRKQMKQTLADKNFDLGVAWDADADRIFFYLPNGEAIEGYFIGALLSTIILEGNTNEKVLHDPRLIWANLDAIKSSGGIPIAYKTGHMFIKEGMRKYNAIFASEMSAHYYFRDNYFADNGMIPLLLVLNAILKSGKTLEELLYPWTSKYFTPGEINFTVNNASHTIAKIEHKFTNLGKIEKIDGLSVEFEDWRFNLRTSNTEPLLRLNLEATSKALMEEKKAEVSKLIDTFSH